MKSVSEIINVFSNCYERVEEKCVEFFFSNIILFIKSVKRIFTCHIRHDSSHS